MTGSLSGEAYTITRKVEEVKNDLGFTNQIRLNTKAEERAALIDFYEKLNSWYIQVRDFGFEFRIITALEVPVVEEDFTSAKLHERLDAVNRFGTAALIAKSKVDLYVDTEANKDITEAASAVIQNMHQSRQLANEHYLRYYYAVKEFFAAQQDHDKVDYQLNIAAVTAVVEKVIADYAEQAQRSYGEFHKLLPPLRKALHARLLNGKDYVKAKIEN